MDDWVQIKFLLWLCASCIVSAGIDDLLQTVLWVAEEKALMANPSRLAAGTVIEAHLDKKRGPVATMLVQVCTSSGLWNMGFGQRIKQFGVGDWSP